MVERLFETAALALLLVLPAACGKFAAGEPAGKMPAGGEKAPEEEKVTDFDFSLTYFYDWSDSTRRLSLTLDGGGNGTYALSCGFNRDTVAFPVYNENGERIPDGGGIALERGVTRFLTTDVEMAIDSSRNGTTRVREYYVEMTLKRGDYSRSHSALLEAISQFVVGDVDTSGEYTRFGVWRPTAGGLVYHSLDGESVKVLLDGKPLEGLKEVTDGGTQAAGPELNFGGSTVRRDFELPRLGAGRHAVMVVSGSRSVSLADDTDYPYTGFIAGYTFTEPKR